MSKSIEQALAMVRELQAISRDPMAGRRGERARSLMLQLQLDAEQSGAQGARHIQLELAQVRGELEPVVVWQDLQDGLDVQAIPTCGTWQRAVFSHPPGPRLAPNVR